MTINEQYNHVIETLKLLSFTYEEQVEIFDDFVDVPYEVISDFEDSFYYYLNLLMKDCLMYFNFSDSKNLYKNKVVY